MSDQIRDSLDDAIDRIAANLVSVQEDPDAARRILSSLPPRDDRRWWNRSSLPLQTVAFASVVLAVVYLRFPTEDDPRSHEAARPSAILEVKPTTSLAVSPQLASPEPGSLGSSEGGPKLTIRRAPSGRRNRLEPQLASFELSAVPAPEQLTMTTLVATTPLDAVEPTLVEPILLSSLPLASDTQTPFSKE